jgi:hypothetical protein
MYVRCVMSEGGWCCVGQKLDERNASESREPQSMAEE